MTASCYYDELSEDDVRQLAAAVDALSEPLSAAHRRRGGMTTESPDRGILGGGAAAAGVRRRVRRRPAGREPDEVAGRGGPA